MSIKAEDLCFTYFEDGKNVLDGLGVEIDKNKITILTGPSGCGKSTLLFVLAGLYPGNAGFLRSGSVLVEGREIAGIAPPERARLAGMMFQNPDLQFCMDTVFNELVFCLENVREDPEMMEQKIDSALEFCGITHLKNRQLNTLSGGEKQKAMLACAAVLEPEWLLLDEPFANIDDDSAGEIIAKLVSLHKEKGMGILAVDHRLDNWMGAADCIRVMKDGKVAPDVLDPQNREAMYAKLDEYGVAVPGRPYRQSRESAGAAPDAEKQVILRIEDLTLSYPGSRKKELKTVLDGVSAEFRSGTVYAVIGKSGAGKSSFFSALSGLYKYSGSIALEGKDIRKLGKDNAGAIGFVTQSPQDQFIGGTVKDEVMAALKNDPEGEKKCEEILRGIRLWKYRDISPYMLSQGQQRRLGTATLLTYPCRVLVCDEPTYAQDRNNTTAIMDSLCGNAREHDIAMIFSTHDRQLAKDYADVVLELKGGKLVETDKSLL